MKITVATKKGESKILNTDCILFLSEYIKDNPIIIDSQDIYTHTLDIPTNIDSSFLAVVSDGLGSDEAALIASKKVIHTFNEYFDTLLNEISEQEIMYLISDLFVRIEIAIATEVGQNKNYIGASASLAGIFYNKNVGLFIFNAGDVRIYKKEKNENILAITNDHISGNIIENFAGGGGNHYITTTGPIRKKPISHIIVNQGFYENDFFMNENFNKILENHSTSSIVDDIKNCLVETESNSSIICISY